MRRLPFFLSVKIPGCLCLQIPFCTESGHWQEKRKLSTGLRLAPREGLPLHRHSWGESLGLYWHALCWQSSWESLCLYWNGLPHRNGLSHHGCALHWHRLSHHRLSLHWQSLPWYSRLPNHRLHWQSLPWHSRLPRLNLHWHGLYWEGLPWHGLLYW